MVAAQLQFVIATCVFQNLGYLNNPPLHTRRFFRQCAMMRFAPNLWWISFVCDKLMERQTAGFENLYFCEQFGHFRYSKLNQKRLFTCRLTSSPNDSRLGRDEGICLHLTSASLRLKRRIPDARDIGTMSTYNDYSKCRGPAVAGCNGSG